MASDVKQIRVRVASDPYTVFVGQRLLESSTGASLLSSLGMTPKQTCAIITNPRIGRLYAENLLFALRSIECEPHIVEIPEGEQFKTLDTVSSVYDQLVEARLDRRSTIFALGGGVVGDLAGFVAATFLRGVPFVQVPTTLLAMVDASIGGKVAVDHPRGKNLIGAFKQPQAVIVDTQTLATLPEEEWRSGLAEVVKHGIIGDVGLLELLGSKNLKDSVPDWIGRAIRVKIDIVARDPYEQGERATLNLGHTFGHALEQVSRFEMRHGDAVAIGMVCATRLASRLGECRPELPMQIERILEQLGLPSRIPKSFSTKAIIESMQTDKKRVGKRLRFVLPRAPGDVVIRNHVETEDVVAVVEETIAA